MFMLCMKIARWNTAQSGTETFIQGFESIEKSAKVTVFEGSVSRCEGHEEVSSAYNALERPRSNSWPA